MTKKEREGEKGRAEESVTDKLREEIKRTERGKNERKNRKGNENDSESESETKI